MDHRAVIAGERMMHKQEGAAASTICRPLAALSSLFKHLVRHGATSRNPVADVARPAISRAEAAPRRSRKRRLPAADARRGEASKPAQEVGAFHTGIIGH